ncbi:uncharacterized protein LOC114943672 [Nylanderia fulva]|uniref:uncharacterized protein LOC114943672 n=1 Tax=Nylanderia fulva TaxID=613905 RepID=UPI0010FB2976|nr:uncharacterized protein LOC114943672 [Nylanderia fulva]
MEIRSLVIAILIIAVTILQSGEATKCYVCDSRTSQTCTSGPMANETVECPPNLNCGVCNYKLGNGTTILARLCGYVEIPLVQPYRVESGNCKMCSGDYCNAANMISISMATLGCLVSFWAIRFVLKGSY